jgi:hypothetical protein
MTEIYTGSSEYVYLTLAVARTLRDSDTPVTVEITREYSSDEPVEATAERVEVGKYRYLVPLDLTQTDGTLRVKWSYSFTDVGTGSRTDLVDVVTPYVTPDEVFAAYPELTQSDEEIRFAERKVRLLINSYCGQKFNKEYKTIRVRVGDPNRIMLPIRILSLDNAGIVYAGTAYGPYDCTIMPYSIIIPHTSDTYEVKFDGPLKRRENYATLTGWFGFETVPNEVKEAALLLINDIFCMDSIYRQKGITRVRAADWALDFGRNAFVGTGNVDADALLSVYKLNGMAII